MTTEIHSILKKVAELPADYQVSREQELRGDLGIDSIKMIDVVLNVEAMLDVELGDDFSDQLVTVNDLEQRVASLRSS